MLIFDNSDPAAGGKGCVYGVLMGLLFWGGVVLLFC